VTLLQATRDVSEL